MMTPMMSSFFSKKLDNLPSKRHSHGMGQNTPFGRSREFTGIIRRRIERGGERLWRFEDFRDVPPAAVAQALSRLNRQGMLQRLSKGVYYRPRQTTFGKSLPNPAIMQKLASRRKTVFPSGVAAANLLGFTTQTAGRREVATSALSLPRKLIGTDTALLDFLRRAGSTSELSDEETLRKTLALSSEKGRFERLLKVANTEPPRVRAILGAIGEQIGKNPSALRRLRESLNPFSRFDFGTLHGLRHAKGWQARDHR